MIRTSRHAEKIARRYRANEMQAYSDLGEFLKAKSMPS